MSKYPIYLINKQVPDKELLDKIRGMMKEGKSPKEIKGELQNASLYMIREYYSKIRRGIW